MSAATLATRISAMSPSRRESARLALADELASIECTIDMLADLEETDRGLVARRAKINRVIAALEVAQ